MLALGALACPGDGERVDRSASASPDGARERAREIWRAGLALEVQGRHAAALARFREAIELHYEEGWSYYFGYRFALHAPLDEVEAYYRDRVARDPKPQTSHYFWGRALARHGRNGDAVRHLETALEIDPAHEASHELLGDIAAAAGDVERAMAHYRKAIEIHPELTTSHARLAELLQAAGRLPEAEHHREQARVGDANSPRRFFYWGRALLRAGRVDAAIAELEKAVATDPGHAEARELLDEARRRRGS